MNGTKVQQLESLSLGFREKYFTYEVLKQQLEAWAKAFPELCQVRSIGTTIEGRDLLLATIGPDPERARPSVWIDGNMHASEFAGTSVALAMAEDALRLHLTPPGESLYDLPPHVLDRLREVRFFILPRMSPDGAEQVMTVGRYVRSNPRDRRAPTGRARWLHGDVDGDGEALVMRVEDEGGEFVESPDFAGLLVARRLEDPGPYYKVFPEGHIEHFDGRSIPDPFFLSDNDTDLNRNFPWAWAPEPEQVGAGAYPTSEPECRAVVDFVTAHPEIFAWLNLHTFGGVFIRPLGDNGDHKMDREDLGVFREIAAWSEALTGYPTVSGYEEFLYEPERPLHGDLTDFAYHQRGAIAYVCELWDLFAQLGIGRLKPFVDHYTHFTRSDQIRLAKWDREHNHGRLMRPWRPFEHPQLGRVEIGGVDPRVGMWNPPPELLHTLCTGQSRAFFRVAALAPSLSISGVTLRALSDTLTEVEVTLENRGYLGTHILSSARALPWNSPLMVDVRADGCELIDPSQAHFEVGHLGGWGRGIHGGGALFYARSRGSANVRTLRWVVRGAGTLKVSFRAPRVGAIEHTVEISAS